MNANEEYKYLKDVQELYTVSATTLVRLTKADKVRCGFDARGRRLYCLADLAKVYGNTDKDKTRDNVRTVIYARSVSNDNMVMKRESEIEIEELTRKFPNPSKIYFDSECTDVFGRRPELQKLVDDAHHHRFDRLVIKDKFSVTNNSLGYESFAYLMKIFGVEVVFVR